MTACSEPPPGALAGVRVLDLSRILAGPSCTQLLGDLGADVVKVERPDAGDDTRNWGPAYPIGKDGAALAESAYYCAANRNKRSIAIDLATAAGVASIRRLLATADVLVENFKVGTLAKHKLGFADLHGDFPRLVYCSITGFGQSGPYAPRAGYDFVAQALGGLMSVTGEPDGEPMKVGVGIADLMCGMYAAVGILAALRHRDLTGQGQHIDCALLDTTIASLANEGTSFLTSGRDPARLGNEHPNIVPYKVFATADGAVILAVGNDLQFGKWCELAGVPDLAANPAFATNPARLRHRDEINALVAGRMRTRTSADWEAVLGAGGVPCSPINSIRDVFADEHVKQRGMELTMPSARTRSGSVRLIANPLKLSATPASYRREPPRLGEHTDEVMGGWDDEHHARSG